MLLINDHSVKIVKTQPASVVLKSAGYAVKDEETSVIINGTKYDNASSLRHAYLRRNGSYVIKIEDKNE